MIDGTVRLLGSCAPVLRDCLETELRERGMAGGWPFRAALEALGWHGRHDVQLDLTAHRLLPPPRVEGAVSDGATREADLRRWP